MGRRNLQRDAALQGTGASTSAGGRGRPATRRWRSSEQRRCWDRSPLPLPPAQESARLGPPGTCAPAGPGAAPHLAPGRCWSGVRRQQQHRHGEQCGDSARATPSAGATPTSGADAAARRAKAADATPAPNPAGGGQLLHCRRWRRCSCRWCSSVLGAAPSRARGTGFDAHPDRALVVCRERDLPGDGGGEEQQHGPLLLLRAGVLPDVVLHGPPFSRRLRLQRPPQVPAVLGANPGELRRRGGGTPVHRERAGSCSDRGDGHNRENAREELSLQETQSMLGSRSS
mmetsp:Transcript_3706/g.8968  ORF Transcript_3706/g.8968 Transcript_3706/m.8968 type:complete len:286 (-) Transcript_3706:401-1258(-)